MVLSASAQSGLLEGERREDLAIGTRLPGQGAGDAIAQHVDYQQDRHVAFAGDALTNHASPGKMLAGQLNQLADKNAQSVSSAAASMVHVDTVDTADGRALKLSAASLGDCDVFVAVKSGADGTTRVRRLFDEFDYPDEFGPTTQPTRKLIAGIGMDTMPECLEQSAVIPLQPDDKAVVFSASDGYWDGYAALNRGTARGLGLDQINTELRDRIATSVDRGLAGDDAGMADHLVEDLIRQSQEAGLPNTDNISATALVVAGSGPKPEPVVIGSIDGSGAVGPTEAMVDDMVADIHQQQGPSILPKAGLGPAHAVTGKLAAWRKGGEAPAPTAQPGPLKP